MFEGSALGLSEDFSLGTSDGFPEGDELRISVGLKLGAVEGETLGLILVVGNSEGALLG